jgi:hypothetical protein
LHQHWHLPPSLPPLLVRQLHHHFPLALPVGLQGLRPYQRITLPVQLLHSSQALIHR